MGKWNSVLTVYIKVMKKNVFVCQVFSYLIEIAKSEGISQSETSFRCFQV